MTQRLRHSATAAIAGAARTLVPASLAADFTGQTSDHDPLLADITFSG